MALYETRGTDIMECMLLRQYTNSPNLKEYITAYVKELDILFTEIERVNIGRQLDHATGKQLDIIGDILQQKRSIVFPNDYFGFEGAAGAQSFGTLNADQITANAAVGGVFKSLNDSGFVTTPLNDIKFRKLLRLRAYCLGINNSVIDNASEFTQDRQVFGFNELYKAFSVYVLGHQSILDDTYLTSNLIQAVSVVGHEVTVDVSSSIASTQDMAVLTLLNEWFMPLTYKLTIVSV